MGKRDEYVWELATTVTEMFAVGTTDPSATEIAQAHFPGKALGGEIHEGIRKRLHRIRDVLSESQKTSAIQSICSTRVTTHGSVGSPQRPLPRLAFAFRSVRASRPTASDSRPTRRPPPSFKQRCR